MSSAVISGSVRSYVLRQGRMTNAQKKALEHVDQFTIGQGHALSPEESTIDPSSLFGNQNPTILEIGFGMGHLMVEMALLRPDYNFIGVEVHLPGIAKATHELKKHGLNNVRIVRQDAYLTMHRILSDSISKVLLFFPDPWPKKRQQKRRIVTSKLITEVSRILVAKGVWHIATDCIDYAGFIQEKIEESEHFTTLKKSDESLHSRPVTKYEERGIRLENPISDLYYERLEK